MGVLVRAPADDYNFVMFWQGNFLGRSRDRSRPGNTEGYRGGRSSCRLSPAESKSSQQTRLPLQCAPAVHPDIPKPEPLILATVAYSGK
jgi:hypothetical protein